MTTNHAPRQNPSPARAMERSDPRVDSRHIGVSSYGEPKRQEIEIVGALARANPRAFWQLAKPWLSSNHDAGHETARFCGADERLLRLALRQARSSTRQSGYRAGSILVQLTGLAMAFDKAHSPQWFAQRALDAVPALNLLAASSVFHALSHAARHGRLEAARVFVEALPDKKASEAQAKRHTYGACGFERSGMGDPESRAWARAATQAKLAGDPIPPYDKRAMGHAPSNAIFWIGARWEALRGSDPASAAAWGEIGVELIARGIDVAGGSESLSCALICDPMRKALISSRPALGQPSFYAFQRDSALAEAFSRASPDAVAEIVAYEETGAAARSPMQVSARGKSFIHHPIPAAAWALLAGHDPDPAWMSLGAEREFKIPGRLIERAAAGTLTSKDASDAGYAGSGRLMTLDKLAAALGKAAAPAAKPRKARSAKP